MLIPYLPACKCKPRTQCCYTGKEANASMAHEAEAGRGMAVQNEGLQRRGSHWCGQWERRASSKSAAASAAQKFIGFAARGAGGKAEDAAGR